MSHSKRTLDIRKPYSGLSRSLVIAIDVGTTFSGVSYAILEPGEIPKIHGVTRFPGQEHVAGNSKIPSVIFYDKYGRVMAAGAEAENTSVQAQAEDEGWIKAELFKLRLRPRTMQLNMNGMRLSPLPKRKTPTHVFGDFLSYLYRCTRSFISDTHANGQPLFTSVEHDIQFVLSHPNGWEGPQQTRMRAAAVYAGLVPDTDNGRARIWFVTEGEASLHACVLSGLASEVLSNPSKHGFLIADAGGGTLDISAYAVKGTSPLTIEEIAPPDCIFAGSVFVSRRAREFLEEKLKNSKYGTPDSLDHITRKFDETTKRLFRDRNELQFILFGSPLDKDAAVGIRSGQLRLTGNEVANLFEPSVDAAVNAIKRQVEASKGLIKSVFLVGGYAASPWLFQQLQERLRPYSITVSRPDTQTSKAVADGAIGFYCDHHVSARMSKFMYGVEFLREMDPSDPEHVSRRERLCELPSGPKLLPDAFDCILARGVKVKESTVFTRKYCTELTNLSMLSVFEVEIWCFRGGNDIPKWINRHDDKFSTLCVVQADLSLLNGSAEPKVGTNGKKYWTIVFSVEIHFGLTEFKARIKWMDNGQVKYGPAVIVYNERGHRIEDEDFDLYPEDDTQSYQTSRRNGTPPASRPRTPVNAYYPSNPITGSAPSHRTSTMSTSEGRGGGGASSSSNSKPHASPIAPSISARSVSGAPSDSERSRKGKERDGSAYEDRDRASVYTATPTERTRSGGGGGSVYGPPPPMSTRGSAAGAGSIYSPSVRPPQSRSVSFYDGEAGNGAGDYPPPLAGSPGQAWGAGGGTPKSAADEHRQNHQWGDENNIDGSPSHHHQHQSPGSAQLDAILGRPRSPFPAPSGGSPAAGGAEPSGNNNKSPFAQSAVYDFGGGGGLNDRPKSAFGDVPPPPLTFGDEGPAAAAAAAAAAGGRLFRDPPASVFGESAGPVAGAGETNQNSSDERWAYGSAPATPATNGLRRGKKKISSAGGTPASGSGGLASKTNSPSAFGVKVDDAGAGAGAGGQWGTTVSSKAPSPYDKGKPLSPLNPASQMNNDGGSWGGGGDYAEGGGGDFNEGGGAAGGGESWGFDDTNGNPNEHASAWGFNDQQGGNEAPSGWNLNEPAKVPSRAPSPVPPPVGKKKKQKGMDEKKKKEDDDAKKRLEDQTREQEAAEERRQEAEGKRLKEEQDRKEKEDQENARKAADEEKKRLDAETKATRRTSLLGPTASFLSGAMDTVSAGLAPPGKPWASADAGGGDDSWGLSSFGAANKQKKGKDANATATARPSAFGGGLSSFGNSSWGFSNPVESQTSPLGFSSNTADNLFDFGSSTAPNLDLDLGSGGKTPRPVAGDLPPDEAQSAQTPTAETGEGVAKEGGEGAGEGAGGAASPEDDLGFEEMGGKKKKKGGKKGAGGDDPGTSVDGPAPAAETTAPAADNEGFAATGGKKKKKKK